MKVLLITHHRRFKTFARSEAFARILAKRGFSITLICISDHAHFRIKEYPKDGFLCVEMPDLLPGRLRSGWDLWDTVKRISYLNGKKFDLIHAFETRPTTIYPVMSYLRKNSVPLVIDWIDWWGRGGLITEQRPWWYQKLFSGIETYYEERFRPLAYSTTVISRALGKRAESLGVDPETIYWIPDEASVDLFLPKDHLLHRCDYGLSPEHFVLGYSALDVVGDADLLLPTLKLISDVFPETILLTTGRKSAQLEKLAVRLGIERHFRQLGFLPYEKLPEALSCVDVFLLPFRNTIANLGRFPHKIMDYMAVGRPTISNPVGEIKHLLEKEKIGLLADETAEDLAEKIIQLRENPELRQQLGKNARFVAESKFSWECNADRLEQCYRQTLDAFTDSNFRSPST